MSQRRIPPACPCRRARSILVCCETASPGWPWMGSYHLTNSKFEVRLLVTTLYPNPGQTVTRLECQDGGNISTLRRRLGWCTEIRQLHIAATLNSANPLKTRLSHNLSNQQPTSATSTHVHRIVQWISALKQPAPKSRRNTNVFLFRNFSIANGYSWSVLPCRQLYLYWRGRAVCRSCEEGVYASHS